MLMLAKSTLPGTVAHTFKALHWEGTGKRIFLTWGPAWVDIAGQEGYTVRLCLKTNMAGVEAHAYNPSTQETDWIFFEFKGSLVGLHSKYQTRATWRDPVPKQKTHTKSCQGRLQRWVGGWQAS